MASAASHTFDPVVATNLRRSATKYAGLNEESTVNFKYDEELLENRMRILHLHPGSNDDPILCSLKLRPLRGGAETFDAVSYCWGDESEPQKITCTWRVGELGDDGSLVHSWPEAITNNFAVTRSLYQLLKSIRHPQNQRRLWIDQICINQKNLEERGRQVRLMSEIYSAAACVFVYLGDEDQESDVAFPMMIWLADTSHLSQSRAAHLVAALQTTTRDSSSSSVMLEPQDREVASLARDFKTYIEPVIRRDLYTGPECGSIPDLGMRAFRNLLVKPAWYLRTWTFQEAAMASDAAIICGTWNQDWKTFYKACTSTIVKSSLSDSSEANSIYRKVLDSIDQREDLRYNHARMIRINNRSIDDMVQAALQPTRMDMEDLVWMTNDGLTEQSKKTRIKSILPALRSTICKDSRDKVLGLLGISHDDGRWIVFPAYTMPVRNLYLCVVKYWMEDKQTWGDTQLPHQGLNKTWSSADEGAWIDLSFLSHVQESNPEQNLPSWVPDWSCPATRVPFISLSNLSSRFNACGGSEAEATMDCGDFWSDIPFHPRLTVSGVRVLEIADIKDLTDQNYAGTLSATFDKTYPTTTLAYIDVHERISSGFKISDCFISPEHVSTGFWPYIEDRKKKRSPVQLQSNKASSTRATSEPALHTYSAILLNPTAQFHASRIDEALSLEVDFQKIKLCRPACQSLEDLRRSRNDSTGPKQKDAIFVTKEGFIGLGPDRMDAGDEIWVFKGMGVLAVLRKRAGPKKGSNKEREFIGVALVLGLMSGEAMIGSEGRIEDVVLI